MSNSEVLGKFVWHELLTTDTGSAAAFYPKVLPWRTASSSMPGYTIWMAGQTQIGGLMALPADGSGTPSHWLIYVGTPNVDNTCAQAQGLGARVIKVPADIPNVGRFAVLADPQGATFALFTPGAGQPAPTAPTHGGFSWHELATGDVAAALRFYGELFGWRKGPGYDMGPTGVYQIFMHGGEQVGGMCHPGSAGAPPSWLSYVHVADAARAVGAAKAAGGRLVHGPVQVPGGSSIALFTDPQGGAFAVQEAPRAAAQPSPAAGAAPAANKAAANKAAANKAAANRPAAKKPAAKRKPANKKAASKARKPARKAATRKARKTPKRRTARRATSVRRRARGASPRRRSRGRRRR